MSLVNSKDKLTGADTHALSGSSPIDTHVANLTGDLVMAKVLDSSQTQSSGSFPGTFVSPRALLGTAGVAQITFSSVTTPTEASTLVIVVAATNLITTSGTYTKDWLLKRDTTTIDTFSLIGGFSTSVRVDIRLYTNTSPEDGTYTYTLVNNDSEASGAVAAQLFFIEGTDTHVASLDGSAGTDTHSLDGANTQDTNASESLP